MTKKLVPFFLIALLASASSSEAFLGFGKKKVKAPPEFNQKVILEVSDQAKTHQAPRSGYDVGDLQAFHSQHTLPITVGEAFKEIFGQVEMAEKGPRIETDTPDVPAIFEVRLIDLMNDIYNEQDHYRGQVTLAVAMKSPRGEIFWQKTFLGEGYVFADPQFSTGLGPQDAVVDALNDAIEQMKEAIVASPQVRNQLRYYAQSDAARREKEVNI